MTSPPPPPYQPAAAPPFPPATVVDYPVEVYCDPAIANRDRLTTAFRLLLALPHLLIVGGPSFLGVSNRGGATSGYQAGASGGILGLVAGIGAIISWFAILITGKQPSGLRDLSIFFLRWRVRAVAYVSLLRDEYPPFGDGPYRVNLEVEDDVGPRDRVSVAFRLLLAIPHFFILWFLGIGWSLTTIFAWFAILFTGAYPAGLYDFGLGVLRWNTRVEAYMLLLTDKYPPFSLQ